ncbi:hypothetical protein MSG28_015976 [Choristoneura fumiferana]|uniref:Uncharacterized protein n=1 Tax=Choristoneura fumiferana TaxID=7141 RepID=A0ACC0K4V5_CHOFU|nr:hypothetical protein MSG28_015976 [Choristoneura fumiferana]
MAKAMLVVFLLAVIMVCSAVRVHVNSCDQLCSSPTSLAERDECCRDNGYLGAAGCPAEHMYCY